MALREVEELKENAQELLQFRNLSHTFSRKIDELEQQETRKYLKGLKISEILSILSQKHNLKRSFFEFMERESSEYIKNLKWEMMQDAVNNCREEVNIVGLKRQGTKKLEKEEKDDDSVHSDLEAVDPQDILANASPAKEEPV